MDNSVNKYWGGKDVDGWIAEVKSDDDARKDRGMDQLAQMTYQGYFADESDFFRAAKAISAETFSSKGTIRQGAYYAIGLITKHFAFDLIKGNDIERQKAQVAIRSIIRSSNKLVSATVKILPDLFSAMTKSPNYKVADFDEIEAKLKAQQSEGTDEDKQLVADALKSIETYRK